MSSKHQTLSNMDDENNNTQKVVSIYCPFPLVISPHEDDLMARMRDWTKQFGFVQSKEDERIFEKHRTPLCASGCCPEASADQLFAFGCFCYWIFFTDDQFEQAEEYSDLALLESEIEKFATWMVDPPQTYDVRTRFEASFLDLMEKIRRQVSNEDWFRRLQKSWLSYARPVIRERQLNNSKEIGSIEDYLKTQVYQAAGFLTALFCEMASNAYLPKAIYESQEFGSLMFCTEKLGRFTNDIFSFEKEMNAGNQSNIVAVLKKHLRISTKAAINIAIELYNHEMEEFIRLSKSLPTLGPEVDEVVKKVIHGYEVCLRGYLNFFYVSARYDKNGLLKNVSVGNHN